MPLFFDSHSHLNDARFDGDRAEVLSRMKERGVWSLVVGTDRKMSEDAITLARANEGLYAAIGLHPTDDADEIFDEAIYRKFASEKKVVAIGECGLDFSRVPEEKRVEEAVRQTALFEKHIDLAVSNALPLMIHCRDAHPDLLQILESKKKEYSEKLRGNIHFFSEGPETAKKYFDLDFTISFTGVLTFARNYDETVKYAPLDKILSETDCPYVAPVPYRGKRNEPVYVEEVVKVIANIKEQDLEMVREAMVRNAFRAFNI
ncbi:MAG: TatD family hydrolase [Candidatus Paceibacterota bacterium]|jgi:TatD DNase family protein|nr:TatD family hydrolase [Candidatus Paceibacterota bacterium]